MSLPILLISNYFFPNRPFNIIPQQASIPPWQPHRISPATADYDVICQVTRRVPGSGRVSHPGRRQPPQDGCHQQLPPASHPSNPPTLHPGRRLLRFIFIVAWQRSVAKQPGGDKLRGAAAGRAGPQLLADRPAAASQGGDVTMQRAVAAATAGESPATEEVATLRRFED